MMPLLARSSLRYTLRHPWQFGLSVLGIALGVAVVVGVDLANESARQAFRLSVEAVSGRATHQIGGGERGFDEGLYIDLRLKAGVRQAAPIVEGYVTTPRAPGRALLLLGVDPLAEAPFRSYLEGEDSAGLSRDVLTLLLTRPGALLLAAETARDLALKPGDEWIVLAGGSEYRVEVAGLIAGTDRLTRQGLAHVLVADIATAQEILERPGRLDRIDLILDRDAATLATIQARLPPGVELTAAASQAASTREMTRAFQLNLTMLSLLALVVGMFLIYNTMTFSVIQRRSLLGTYRALGVTRSQIFALVLLEAAGVGLLATALGLGLGVLLAEGLVQLVTRTINDLYFALTVQEIPVVPLVLVKGVLLGAGASLAAAALPAWEATRVPARAALSRSAIETQVRRLVPAAALTGAGLGTLGGLLLLLPGGSLGAGFTALFAIVAGFALGTPAATTVLVRALQPLRSALGPLGSLAVRGVAANLSRTAVAIAALTVALAAIVGVGVMVDSFRRSVDRWLEVTLQADLYLTVPDPGGETLDPSVVERLAALPGVAELSLGRRLRVGSPHGEVPIRAIRMASRSYAGFQFLAGVPQTVWPAFDRGNAVLVTEPYAYRHDLAPGDPVTLLTDRGWQQFPIAGVIRDYGSDQGEVIMSRDTLERFWQAPGYTAIGIYATPEGNLEHLSAAVEGLFGPGQEVLVTSRRALREASLEIFDRTFTITVVLRLLVTFVAFVSVLSTLMALQLERAREIAVLRAQGLTGGQVFGVVQVQSGVMGLIAGILSIPLGLVLSLVLILVINRRSFGWGIEVHVDPAILGQAVGLALSAALLAGLYPAWRMARTSPALALREE